MAILKYLQTNARVTTAEMQEMFNIGKDTANRDLKLLLNNGLVRRRGKSRAIYYELVRFASDGVKSKLWKEQTTLRATSGDF